MGADKWQDERLGYTLMMINEHLFISSRDSIGQGDMNHENSGFLEK